MNFVMLNVLDVIKCNLKWMKFE